MEIEGNSIYSCGVCLQEVPEIDIPDHECIQGMPAVLKVMENYRFYPQKDNLCQANITVDGHMQLLWVDKEFLMGLIKASTDIHYEQPPRNKVANTLPSEVVASHEQNYTKKEMEFNFCLLDEIEKFPILWDYTLPIEERSKIGRENAWKKISHNLNEELSPEECKKRFKNLNTTYGRIKCKYKPSGSAAEVETKWPYFERMMFLEKVNNQKNSTFSNLSFKKQQASSSKTFTSTSTNSIDQENPNTAFTKSMSENPQPKNRRRSEDITAAINELTKAVATPSPMASFTNPNSSDHVVDPLDGLMSYMKSIIKSIPLPHQTDTVEELLQVLFSAQKRHSLH